MHVGGVEVFIVLLVVVLLFGSGKISALLGDLARGLKTFKTAVKEPDVEPPREPEEVGEPIDMDGRRMDKVLASGQEA